jgi:hypothetical protein
LNDPKHILIVNYDFPPNEGIGGRRWAKFAKQLANSGYVVHVIKAEPVSTNQESPWTKDVEHPNIHVYSLPRKYPENFSHPGKDFLSKITYRIQKYFLEKNESGTIYDISIGWEKVLIPKCIEVIRKYNIRNVIASGAPWKMLYDVAGLKYTFPSLQIITDYRDPWLNGKNYGMPRLSSERKKEEERKQTYVLENSSVVVTPYDYLTQELKAWSDRHCKHKSQFQTISHFFDPEDIQDNNDYKSDDSKITIVYGGDLYIGMEKELEFLKKSVEELKVDSPELYEKLQLNIYTNKHETTFFQGLDAVNVKSAIGKRIFEEISKADMCLIMLPSNKKNDRTTKFFEYLPFKKPLLIVADEGEVTSFVKKFHLGFTLNQHEGSLKIILEKILSGESSLDDSLDVNNYSLSGITQQLIALFK